MIGSATWSDSSDRSDHAPPEFKCPESMTSETSQKNMNIALQREIIHRFRRAAHRIALATMLACGIAQAQAGFMDRLQSGLDNVVRGMDYVGQKAGEWIGPGLGVGETKKAAVTRERSVSERYPVGPTPTVALSNEFGAIRINTWEDRVVQVNADIRVGAENDDVAEEVAQGVSFHVVHNEDRVEIRTQLPEIRREMGYLAIEVNYDVTIPKSAGLITDNFFGDTIIRGAGGPTIVEARYGAVELTAITGDITVRAHGEFPVKAEGLARGGTFQMHNALAEFSGVSGELRISNFRGAISLFDIKENAIIDAAAEGGGVRLVLPADAAPDLTATAVYGNISSEYPLSRTIWGPRSIARAPNESAAQRIRLSAVFGDILIEQPRAEGDPTPRPIDGSKPFNDVVTIEEAAPEGVTILIDAIPGDLRIEGSDDNTVRVTATRIVWTPTAAQAPAALEALQAHLRRDGDRLRISTAVTADMKMLGCEAYGVHLHVQCPRTLPIEVRAQEGAAQISDIHAPVSIHQNAGAITATNILAPISVANQNGGATLSDCTGPVEAAVRYGSLSLVRIAAKITAHSLQGRTIIENAGGEVLARSTGGDIRILAMEGIGGDFDVIANQGNCSMLLSPEADATLSLKASNGSVHSAIPLTGTITRESQEFHARLKDGLYAVRIETQHGDIFLD